MRMDFPVNGTIVDVVADITTPGCILPTVDCFTVSLALVVAFSLDTDWEEATELAPFMAALTAEV